MSYIFLIFFIQHQIFTALCEYVYSFHWINLKLDRTSPAAVTLHVKPSRNSHQKKCSWNEVGRGYLVAVSLRGYMAVTGSYSGVASFFSTGGLGAKWGSEAT